MALRVGSGSTCPSWVPSWGLQSWSCWGRLFITSRLAWRSQYTVFHRDQITWALAALLQSTYWIWTGCLHQDMMFSMWQLHNPAPPRHSDTGLPAALWGWERQLGSPWSPDAESLLLERQLSQPAALSDLQDHIDGAPAEGVRSEFRAQTQAELHGQLWI